ncbi:MAG: response regulator, partial [Oligoflexales bacterium]|nr:response regulator [Oligoflexales bacterium]
MGFIESKSYRLSNEIMIIDDCPDSVHLLTTITEKAGYTAVGTIDAASALSLLSTRSPELILLDIHMPLVNGFELSRKIKENPLTKEIPIIFITCLTDIESKRNGFESGCSDYITKPFDIDEVRLRIDHHICLRRYREELERKNILLKAQGEASWDGIAAIDSDGKVMLYNENIVRMWGIPDSMISEQDEREVLKFILGKLEHPDHFLKKLRSLFGNEKQKDTYELCLKDGRIFEGYSSPLSSDEGKFLGRILFFRDVTEKHRLWEHLRHLDKLETLGVLASRIAHDFNNLLAGVFGYTQLARRYCNDGRVLNHINKVNMLFDRAKGLTQKLMAFSRGGVPSKKTFSILDLLHRQAKFATGDSNALYEIKAAGELGFCEADEDQIIQLIENILKNSIQAMPEEGGKITIFAENADLPAGLVSNLKAGKYVKLTFEDTGHGIEPDII